MRSVSGPRNRLILVAAAVVLLLVAAWLASASFGLADRWPQAEVVLPHGDSTPASLAAAHASWLLPVAAAVSVLAVLLGLWMLVLQVPARPATSTLRLRDEDGTLLGTLEPAVLGRALADHAEAVPGVLDASVQVSGTATSPRVQASVTLADEAETAWAVDAVRRQLADDLRTVLGAEVPEIDLLLRLRSSSAPTRAVVEAPAPTAPLPASRSLQTS